MERSRAGAGAGAGAACGNVDLSGVSVAYLFPGQGAQIPGFLKRLPQHPGIADTLREARGVLNMDIDALDGIEALHSTVNVQLGLLIGGVAVTRALALEGMSADAAAGLSVGAFGAAVACGSLSFADALSLVKLRAESMQDLYPRGFGMAAITGLDERRIGAILSQVGSAAAVGGAAAQVFIANINAPTQVVIAGADAALEAALQLARESGARHVQRMMVSVPSHSPLLDAVSQRLAQAIAKIDIGAPHIPYISNRRARAVRDAAGVREDLALNVSNPVRWHDSMTVLYELGIRLFVEMPPGRVLTDLAQQNFPEARAIAADDAHLKSILSSYQRVMR
jgi:malonate decarboxylase epsilon subunit